MFVYFTNTRLVSRNDDCKWHVCAILLSTLYLLSGNYFAKTRALPQREGLGKTWVARCAGISGKRGSWWGREKARGTLGVVYTSPPWVVGKWRTTQFAMYNLNSCCSLYLRYNMIFILCESWLYSLAFTDICCTFIKLIFHKYILRYSDIVILLIFGVFVERNMQTCKRTII